MRVMVDEGCDAAPPKHEQRSHAPSQWCEAGGDTEGDMTKDWFANDDLFFDELAEGHEWAERVAAKLRAAALPVEVTPMRRRATIEHRHEFAKEVDLFVGSKRVPIEVKSRRLRFTDDPATYPYNTAFIDTVSGWDAKEPRPMAVVLISQHTGGMLVVPPSTSPSWVRESRRDRVRNIQDTWYCAPKGQLKTMDSLIDWLRPRTEPTFPGS